MGSLRAREQRDHSRRGHGLLNTIVYAGFDQETLDREYSPSSCIQDINVYLRQYAQLSDSVRASNDHSPDLRFGPDDAQVLDLFLPKSGDLPALQVFVHGGYWQLLSKEESSFAASMFVNQGIAFAAVNYTLAPHKTLSGIVDEIETAIAWLFKNADGLGFDANRIHVSGSSAGAHLAAMLLSTDWSRLGVPQNAIKGICAVSGVYDLEPVRLTYVNEKVGMDEDVARSMSPQKLEPVNVCPVILAYGDNETNEFKRQTDDYANHLRARHFDVEFAEISNRNHFDIILDLTDAESWLGRKTLEQMRANKTAG